MAGAEFEVVVTSAARVHFDGRAESLIVPGEQGVFEVLNNHRPLASRLRQGVVVIDGKALPIRRGLMRVADDRVLVVVETDA